MVEEHEEPRIHTFGSKRREQMIHTFGSRQHSKETDGTFIEELFNSKKADRTIVVPLVLLIVGLVLICLIFFKWRTWRNLGHQTLKEIKVTTTSTPANDVKLESEGEGSSLSAHLTSPKMSPSLWILPRTRPRKRPRTKRRKSETLKKSRKIWRTRKATSEP